MKKSTLFLLVLTLFCCTVAAFCLRIRKNNRERSSVEFETSGAVAKFEPSDAASIRISWRDIVATLVRKDGVWVVSEKMNHPADPAMILSFLDGLSKLHPLKLILPADRPLLERLHLSPVLSDPKLIPGVRCVIADRDGKILADYLLGRGHFLEDPSSPVAERRTPDGRYIGRVISPERVIPFLCSQVFEEYPPMPGAWLESPLFRGMEGMVSLSFSSKKWPSWKISRNPSSPSFALDGPEVQPVSPQALSSILSTLNRHYVSDVLPGKSLNLQPVGIFTVRNASGSIRGLRFYTLSSQPKAVFASVFAKGPGVSSDWKKYSDWIYEIPEPLFEVIRTKPVQQQGKK